MKRILGNILRKAGIYNKVRYSRLFTNYEKWFHRERLDAKQREVDFYRSFLPPCRLIFDIGAHDGHKTEAFLQMSEKVVCCEPDAKNFKLLRDRFRARKRRVSIENLALSNHPGVMDMYVHHEGSAFNTVNPKFKDVLEKDENRKWSEKIKFATVEQVFVTTLDEMIAKYGKPDFIKIDTEGNELAVISGLSEAVKFISVECLVPDFTDEMKMIIDHLQTLSPDCTYNLAAEERLIFNSFVLRDEVVSYLDQTDDHHFELIVKMEAHSDQVKKTDN